MKISFSLILAFSIMFGFYNSTSVSAAKQWCGSYPNTYICDGNTASQSISVYYTEAEVEQIVSNAGTFGTMQQFGSAIALVTGGLPLGLTLLGASFVDIPEYFYEAYYTNTGLYIAYDYTNGISNSTGSVSNPVILKY